MKYIKTVVTIVLVIALASCKEIPSKRDNTNKIINDYISVKEYPKNTCSSSILGKHSIYTNSNHDISDGNNNESLSKQDDFNVNITTEGDLNGISVDVELIAKDTLYEYKYYSPDNKNYIRVGFDYDEISEQHHRNLYLNDTKTIIGETYIDLPRLDAKWIDNDNVLILGKFILNVKTNEKTNIRMLFDNNLQESFINYRSFDLNKDKTKIAYCIYEIKNEETNRLDWLRNYAHIYIYDIEKNTLEFNAKKDILQYDGEPVEYVPLSFRWDKYKSEILYFDSYQYNFLTNEVSKLGDTSVFSGEPSYNYLLSKDKKNWLGAYRNKIEIYDTIYNENINLYERNNQLAEVIFDFEGKFVYTNFIEGNFYVFAKQYTCEEACENSEKGIGNIYKITIKQ
ncbi:MAG: hypothetical protein N4A50_04235 [Vallitalea sp.]|jgi:hypothetical protein|nr:hypothetical protein [Vallitalea sp.]